MPDITATRPVSGQPIETSWGQQAHDLVEGIQSGRVDVGPFTGAASATAAVTFPRAYATAPVSVVVTMASTVCQARVFSITATGFSIEAKRSDGGGSTTQPVMWLAIGTPA